MGLTHDYGIDHLEVMAGHHFRSAIPKGWQALDYLGFPKL
jgi:hypothetical protein